MVDSAPREPQKSKEDADTVSTTPHKKQKSTTIAQSHTQTQLDWIVEPTTKYCLAATQQSFMKFVHPMPSLA
jgi:hypothetical protein